MNNRLTLRGQFLWKKWQEMKLEKKKIKIIRLWQGASQKLDGY